MISSWRTPRPSSCTAGRRREGRRRQRYQREARQAIIDCSGLIIGNREVRDRICNLTPRRTDIHRELYENMDAELFEQMVTNGAFRGQEMWNLVDYVFSLIKQREAPARNASTSEILQELHELLQQSTTSIATFVPVFLRKAHQKIDEIDNDKKEFLKQFKK